MSKEAYFRVGREGNKDLGDLVPLKNVDLTEHFPKEAQNQRKIILEDVIATGEVRHFLVKSWEQADEGKIHFDGKSGRVKKTELNANLPDFVSISEGKLYALQVEPYSDMDILHRTISNTDKVQMADMRKEVCRLAELTSQIEMMSRTSDENVKYTGPKINVDGIRHALTPASSNEQVENIADRVSHLDYHSAGFIRTNMLAFGLSLPEELHDALLVRIGQGRHTELNDRVSAGLLVEFGREIVCPLESPHYDKRVDLGKFWTGVALAQGLTRVGDDERAQEKVTDGLRRVIRKLQPIDPEIYKKTIVLGEDEGEKNMKVFFHNEKLKALHLREFTRLADNPQSIVYLIKKGEESRQIAGELGKEYQDAYERWMPVLIGGMDGVESSETISFHAKLRERIILEEKKGDRDKEQIMKAIILRNLESYGAGVREGLDDEQLHIHASGLFGTAIAWSNPLQMDKSQPNRLWNTATDDLVLLSEPEKLPTLNKALRAML